MTKKGYQKFWTTEELFQNFQRFRIWLENILSPDFAPPIFFAEVHCSEKCFLVRFCRCSSRFFEAYRKELYHRFPKIKFQIPGRSCFFPWMISIDIKVSPGEEQGLRGIWNDIDRVMERLNLLSSMPFAMLTYA